MKTEKRLTAKLRATSGELFAVRAEQSRLNESRRTTEATRLRFLQQVKARQASLGLPLPARPAQAASELKRGVARVQEKLAAVDMHAKKVAGCDRELAALQTKLVLTHEQVARLDSRCDTLRERLSATRTAEINAALERADESQQESSTAVAFPISSAPASDSSLLPSIVSGDFRDWVQTCAREEASEGLPRPVEAAVREPARNDLSLALPSGGGGTKEQPGGGSAAAGGEWGSGGRGDSHSRIQKVAQWRNGNGEGVRLALATKRGGSIALTVSENIVGALKVSLGGVEGIPRPEVWAARERIRASFQARGLDLINLAIEHEKNTIRGQREP